MRFAGLFALPVLLTSLAAFAGECPDLSGKYVQQKSASTELSIDQWECEAKISMKIDGRTSTKTYFLDGIFRELDGYMTSGTSNRDVIQLQSVFPSGTSSVASSIGTLYLDADGNLISTLNTYDKSGSEISSDKQIFKKQ